MSAEKLVVISVGSMLSTCSKEVVPSLMKAPRVLMPRWRCQSYIT